MNRGLQRIGFCLLAVSIATGGCAPEKEEALSQAVPVEVVDLEAGDIPLTLEAAGLVQPAARIFVIGEVPGEIAEIGVDVGDRVEAGQRVAHIDDTDYRLAYNDAEAALAVARANVDRATLTYGRVKKLHEMAALSQDQFDEAESVYHVAQAMLRRAEAGHALAREQLGKCNIESSISGWIAKKNIDKGALVSPEIPLFEVIDIETLKVFIQVTEKDYARIDPDDAVEIRCDAYPGERFSGSITKIGIDADLATGNFSVEIRLDNGDLRLKSGMSAHVTITTDVLAQVIAVPQKALLVRQSGNLVFLVDDAGKARAGSVTAGLSLGDNVIITDGLAPGDRLVVSGQHYLEEGTAVDIKTASAPMEQSASGF